MNIAINSNSRRISSNLVFIKTSISQIILCMVFLVEVINSLVNIIFIKIIFIIGYVWKIFKSICVLLYSWRLCVLFKLWIFFLSINNKSVVYIKDSTSLGFIWNYIYIDISGKGIVPNRMFGVIKERIAYSSFFFVSYSL